MISQRQIGIAQIGDLKNPGDPRNDTNSDRRNFFPKVDTQFQWRYSFAMALSVGLTLLVFMAPFLYFLSSNFDIFRDLAIHYQPNLLEHLEREVQWIYFLGFSGIICAVMFSIAFGFKLTGSILGPLFSIERHMRIVSQGDWKREDFRVRATDEFKRMASTYAFLYRSIRGELVDDLETLDYLKTLTASPRHLDEMKFAIEKLIAMKVKKLGLSSEEYFLQKKQNANSENGSSTQLGGPNLDPNDGNAANSASFREKRRAS